VRSQPLSSPLYRVPPLHLRFSVPRVRKKRIAEANLIEAQVALHSARLAIGSEVVSEASPGNDDNIECLYIEA